MKRSFLMFFALCFLAASFLGCASITRGRRVENNTFVSSWHPQVAIEVDPAIAYLGNKKGNQEGETRYAEISSNIKTDRYYFGQIDEYAWMKRIVYIEVATFSRERVIWNEDPHYFQEQTVDSGIWEIDGKTWYYGVFCGKDLFDEENVFKLGGQWFADAREIAVLGLARRTGPANETATAVWYFVSLEKKL